MSSRAPVSHVSSTEPLGVRPTAIVPNLDRHQPIVLVLGAPRSGASLCSRVLGMLGVDMLDQISASENVLSASGDPHHCTQRSEIVEFHDRILELFNREDRSAYRDFALPVAWWTDPRVVRVRHEISEFVGRKLGKGYFGFEDRRTVRVMPVWHHIIHQHKLAPRILFCLRNPAQSARSDGVDSTLEEYQWLVHTVEFFKHVNNFDICTIQYENWFDDRLSNVNKILKFLGIECPQVESELDSVLSSIIYPAARYDSPFAHEAREPLVRSLYDLAKRADRDGEARDQIHDIVSQFVGFQQLQQPLQRSLENLVGAATRLPTLELEAADLRVAVEDRTALAESAVATANTAEAGLTMAVAALEAQRAELAEAVRERDERQAALEAQRAETAEAVRERDEQQAALAAAHADLAALRSAVADREADRENVINTLQTALADALAEAARDAAQSALAGAATQRVVREQLALAEAELQVLRGALVVAREVGAAVIAAFTDRL